MRGAPWAPLFSIDQRELLVIAFQRADQALRLSGKNFRLSVPNQYDPLRRHNRASGRRLIILANGCWRFQLRHFWLSAAKVGTLARDLPHPTTCRIRRPGASDNLARPENTRVSPAAIRLAQLRGQRQRDEQVVALGPCNALRSSRSIKQKTPHQTTAACKIPPLTIRVQTVMGESMGESPCFFSPGQRCVLTEPISPAACPSGQAQITHPPYRRLTATHKSWPSPLSGNTDHRPLTHVLPETDLSAHVAYWRVCTLTQPVCGGSTE